MICCGLLKRSFNSSTAELYFPSVSIRPYTILVASRSKEFKQLNC